VGRCDSIKSKKLIELEKTGGGSWQCHKLTHGKVIMEEVTLERWLGPFSVTVKKIPE
jgi:hypothetical protein